jgi:hypothetical protein
LYRSTDATSFGATLLGQRAIGHDITHVPAETTRAQAVTASEAKQSSSSRTDFWIAASLCSSQ